MTMTPLPEELRFLEKWLLLITYEYDDEGWIAFAKNFPIGQLRIIAGEINAHKAAIDNWLTLNPITESAKSRKVYLGLYALLDFHGLLK